MQQEIVDMRIFVLLTGVLISGIFSRSYAQSDLVSFLLRRIASRQMMYDSFYHTGMFPSYRFYAPFPGKPKHDNNIFFTALTCYTIRQLKPWLPDSLHPVADSILQRAASAYPFYQKPQHPLTYNFWPINPPEVFPNSVLLKPFRYINALPDDADDASMIWLALHPPDSIILAYHAYMAQYANTIHQPIRNTYRTYKHLPFYSTWFGKKMPVDVDFCVLCNVLTLFYSYRIPLNKYDSASIRWLNEMIGSRRYLSDAAYISPHYARPPVLIYHAARLWQTAHPEWMKPYIKQLQTDAIRCLQHTNCAMDSIILYTSLMRLGAKPEVMMQIDPDRIEAIEQQPCAIFFEAGFYAMLRNPFKRWFIPLGFIKYYFSSPAYVDALLLEYILTYKFNDN
ncbi:hypothetical protein BXY57_1937 [Thermoflavifilum aggregans]|uniref:Uncharacterized protein n=2 Tax=Thermoflavifilum aggregans TaxID=454188 RepID=A0A2M9CWR9_9BACT|nr:hypothetical protein BXY57_1937 [Thermoflavifilum aggregans]